ncbi:NAD(P)/FAD-dependent oxidoreductase [Pseudomonas chlororaphis]|uniref:NAD(P)-binding protein n=1 Tax=Pseudomonas chlororaphis TaxID=587753 RepID=UPI002367E079|nr:FAD/NAD(P)-binding protein [Pseudomonas chlororaphis]WDG77628.1 NAD(P)/FAD-dependent oxidoreductase [Pseudomonas chlororaphis]WDG83135.1 NAD(P)/FAD-dependent oxidoreductase [Pseudomonas chlororaphis]
MSKQYDTVLVGSGLEALAATSLLVQRGQKALVVEKHNMPGGSTSNFRHQDSSLNVSLHSFDSVRSGLSKLVR